MKYDTPLFENGLASGYINVYHDVIRCIYISGQPLQSRLEAVQMAEHINRQYGGAKKTVYRIRVTINKEV